MRDRMERFVFFPFTVGCMSESSIAVGMQQQPKRSNNDTNSTPTRTPEREKEYEENGESENLRSLLPLPKFQKLFKNISQLFVYKDDELEEEAEMGMEIGLPTDVKHVTHIGLDDCALSKGWHTINEAAFLDLPPLSNAS